MFLGQNLVRSLALICDFRIKISMG